MILEKFNNFEDLQKAWTANIDVWWTGGGFKKADEPNRIQSPEIWLQNM